MSKIKFGNFITYKGSNLATPQAKAQNGNLVFAEIESGADKGYYIFGGVAGGHLVTFDVFNALKAEVAALNTKVGDLSIGEGESKVTYKDVPSYIAAYVDNRLKTLEAYKVKDVVVGSSSIVDPTSGVVILGDAAKKNVATAIAKDSADLATAGQVADAISSIKLGATALSSYEATGVIGATGSDNKLATEKAVRDAISTLGTVMEFKGVVTGDDLPAAANFSKGDVIIWNDEEYILDGDGIWCEIGKVKSDEAVLTLSVNQGSTDYITLSGVSGLNGQYSGYVTAGLNVVESDLMKTEGDDLNQLVSAAAVKEAISNIPAATVTGASGYLKVVDKNVVVDADQVQFGATGTSTMLATKGYVDDEIAKVNSEAAKHSSVTSTTPDYISVTGVTAANGSVKYQVSLEDAALAAKNHTIEAIEIGGSSATGATTVQGALQDLFEGDKAASEAYNDLNDRLNTHIGSTEAHAAKDITYAGATGITTTNVKDALDDLYSKVDNIEVPVTSVTGDAASYSDVTTNKAGNVTVKNTLATAVGVTGVTGATAATATGLATDAWVKDYITSILAWEVLTD